MARQGLKAKGIEEFTEEHLGFFYHTLFNKYNALFKTYGQCIICHEGKGSLDWRRNIYPEYKRNRDAGKKDPSYAILKSSFDVIEKVLDNYPCKQVKVKGAEADDDIYALARHYGELGEDVVVISTDGDLVQLLDYSDTISIYNPIKRMFSEKKPNIVKFKAIVGDRSDNIPGVYRLGEKTFEKMMDDPQVRNEKLKGDNYDVYQKFLKIVDLSVFPKEHHEEAIRQVEETEYNTFDIGQIEFFYFDNAMQDHLSRWGYDSSDIMEKLVELGAPVKGFTDMAVDVDGLAYAPSESSGDSELDDILGEFI